MSKTAWIIFAAVVVLVFGGLVFYSQSQKTVIDTENIDAGSVLTASEQSGNIADRVSGNADSKVVLIEYGDFQCPSCAATHAPVTSLVDEYQDKIAFVFRNFPITSAHPHAKAAAATAEAAGLQGKYWEMHNLLFERQRSWSSLSADERTNTFANYAAELELDVDKFNQDIASNAVNQKINFDVALSKDMGVTGTPSFFLNGERLPEDISAAIVQQGSTAGLRDLIDQKLSE